MEEGRVVETGSYDDLMHAQGCLSAETNRKRSIRIKKRATPSEGRSFYSFGKSRCNKWGLSLCFQKSVVEGNPRDVRSLGNVHVKLLGSYILSIMITILIVN